MNLKYQTNETDPKNITHETDPQNITHETDPQNTFVDDILPEVLDKALVMQASTIHYGQLAVPQITTIGKVFVELQATDAHRDIYNSKMLSNRKLQMSIMTDKTPNEPSDTIYNHPIRNQIQYTTTQSEIRYNTQSPNQLSDTIHNAPISYQIQYTMPQSAIGYNT